MSSDKRGPHALVDRAGPSSSSPPDAGADTYADPELTQHDAIGREEEAPRVKKRKRKIHSCENDPLVLPASTFSDIARGRRGMLQSQSEGEPQILSFYTTSGPLISLTQCDLLRPVCSNCGRREDTCEWTEAPLPGSSSLPSMSEVPSTSGAILDEIDALHARLAFLKNLAVPNGKGKRRASEADGSPTSASPPTQPALPPSSPHRTSTSLYPTVSHPTYRPSAPFSLPPLESSLRTTALEYVAAPASTNETTRQAMYSHETFDHHILKAPASNGPFRQTSGSPSSPDSPRRPSVRGAETGDDEVDERENEEPRMFIAFPFNVGAAASISRNQLLQAVIDTIPPKPITDALVVDYVSFLAGP